MHSEDSEDTESSLNEEDMIDSVPPQRKRLSTGREDPRSRPKHETRVKGSGQLEGLFHQQTAVANKSLSAWEGHFGQTKFRVIVKISSHGALKH